MRFYASYYILNKVKVKQKSDYTNLFCKQCHFNQFYTDYEELIMIKQNIKFVTTGQFVTFYNTCRNLSANITVKDIENHRMNINGKELSELMAIRLGLPVTLVIHGDDASIEYNCSCHSLNFYAKVSDISG